MRDGVRAGVMVVVCGLLSLAGGGRSNHAGVNNNNWDVNDTALFGG